ncbi:hypothetical protein Tco_1489559, partial [Tanacetum coccineum]
LSLGYVADSYLEEDPKEDSEEDHTDYPANGGDDDDKPSDDDDDDDDTGDDDEEPFEDKEDDEEEEEHLAPMDSSAVPITDPVPSAEDTKALETNEAAPTPVPSPRRHTTRMSIRPQTPVPFPSEAEVKRLLSLPIPPVSLLTPLLFLLPQIPSPQLLPPPSSLHLPPPVPTSLTLPLSLLPPLPALLFVPPVDHREDTLEAELPHRKRLCLTTPGLRYEMLMSDDREPRRLAMSLGMFGTFAAARAAPATAATAALMTVAAAEQLIKERVSAVLDNHETLRNSTNCHGHGSYNSGTGTRGRY